MCATCGCGDSHHDEHQIAHHVHHHHHNGNGHSHDSKDDRDKKIVNVEQDVLHQNNLLAQRNRGYFQAKGILALNLVSSPGSGKTTLLEKTVRRVKDDLRCYVIEGDQQTSRDADRIHAVGTPVVQINTGKGCHLDAHMVFHAIEHLRPKSNSVVFIENVGNLVCPALFDLGETKRVVIISVTEGDDKPLKYPDMFHTSQLCIINKTDLLPYVPFDVEVFKAYARTINPGIEFIELSALKEQGLSKWLEWLHHHLEILEAETETETL